LSNRSEEDNPELREFDGKDPLGEDESFQSLLYGPGSALDPDPVINEVLGLLQNNKDLVENFKRFLPEDYDDNDQSVLGNYFKLKQQNSGDPPFTEEQFQKLLQDEA